MLWARDSPEGPARHLDVSGQKLSPHCLETIFDSQLPSPKSSPKMPPKLSLPHRRGHFFLFQNYPCGEGNCEAIERQKLSRGNFCPGTSRCLAGPVLCQNFGLTVIFEIIREGPKGSPQKGYPWSGRFLEISLRKYCIKCPKIGEIWAFHGCPFCGCPFWSSSNYYLSNSKTFQDGNGNGNLEEINSNDFLDGNWESMEMKGRLRGPRR